MYESVFHVMITDQSSDKQFSVVDVEQLMYQIKSQGQNKLYLKKKKKNK